MNQARNLMQVARKSLSTDYHCQAETAAEEIGAWLENPQDKPTDLKGEYAILKRWYCHALTQQHKPSMADLAKV